ncbi:MAG: shikimate dehydrogenase [Bacillota bacterium]
MLLDKRVDGKTILTGLVGNPVEHTVSPVLHNSLFSGLGINGIYLPLKVPEKALGDALKGLKALSFKGFNVTIPYKEAVLPYLDEASVEVRLLGTANTVKVDGDKLYGYNTDGGGFLRSFYEETKTRFAKKHVCILGAGGTARTLAIKIAMENAGRISIINRTAEKAEKIANCVNEAVRGAGRGGEIASAAEHGSAESYEMLASSDVIINATSVGMYPNTGDSPLKDDFPFRKEQIVFDVIYNPPVTRLLAQASSRGCRTVNGAGMLFYQGLEAFETWMGMKVDDITAGKIFSEFLKYLRG